MEVTSEFTGDLTAMDAEDQFDQLRSIPECARHKETNFATENDKGKREFETRGLATGRKELFLEESLSKEVNDGVFVTPAKDTLERYMERSGKNLFFLSKEKK